MSRVVALVMSYKSSSWLLKSVVKSLLSQGDILSHIIIIDYGSKNDLLEEIRKIDREKIHILSLGRDPGLLCQRYIGFKYVSSRWDPDYILFIDNDVVLSRGVVKTIFDVMESNPKYGLLSPIIMNVRDRSIYLGNILDFTLRSHVVNNSRLASALTEVLDVDGKVLVILSSYNSGACFMVRREVLKGSGICRFPVKFWYEDFIYSLLAWLKGFKVGVVSSIKAYHLYGYSRKRLSFKKYMKRAYEEPVRNRLKLLYMLHESLSSLLSSIILSFIDVLGRGLRRYLLYPDNLENRLSILYYLKGFLKGVYEFKGLPRFKGYDIKSVEYREYKRLLDTALYIHLKYYLFLIELLRLK